MTVAVAVILIAWSLTGPLATAIGDELGVGDTALTICVDRQVAAAVRGGGHRDRPALPGLARTSATRACAGSSRAASLATILWLLGSAGFSSTSSNFGSYSSTYGSLAGGIVLLLWLWLTNVAVVFGAQFAAELERTANAAREPAPPGEPVPLDPAERAEAPHYSPAAKRG